MKKKLGWLALAFLSSFAGSAWGTLPQRTFVASTGQDSNPCSRTSPCRGFQAAVNAVIDGGEVIVLDSSGYGPVTVSKSVTIVAPEGIYAGISTPASGNATGVLIDTPGVNVVLRGLTINGIGGTYGVRMTNGAKLTVDNCVISNFSSAFTGTGISVEAAAFVSIVGTTIRDGANGVVAGFGSIVNVANSQILLVANEGIQLTGGGAGTSTGIFISDTVVTGTGQGGLAYCIDNSPLAGASGVIEATRATVTSCYRGFENEPASADAGTMTVSRSTASNNKVPFANGAVGIFQSLGDNQVTENGSPSAGTITKIGGQ